MFPLKSQRWIVCTLKPQGIIDTPRATSCDVGSGRVTTVLWSTAVPPDLPWNRNMCGTPNGEWWRFVEKIVMFIACISCMRRQRQKQSTRWVVIGVELHCLHSLSQVLGFRQRLAVHLRRASSEVRDNRGILLSTGTRSWVSSFV